MPPKWLMSSCHCNITPWRMGRRCAQLAFERQFKPALAHCWIYMQGQWVMKQNGVWGTPGCWSSKTQRWRKVEWEQGWAWRGGRKDHGEGFGRKARAALIWHWHTAAERLTCGCSKLRCALGVNCTLALKDLANNNNNNNNNNIKDLINIFMLTTC